MNDTIATLVYIIPVLVILVCMYLWVYVDKSPEYDRISKGALIVWVGVALVPVINVLVAFVSVISVFSIREVNKWFASPVKKD